MLWRLWCRTDPPGDETRDSADVEWKVGCGRGNVGVTGGRTKKDDVREGETDRGIEAHERDPVVRPLPPEGRPTSTSTPGVDCGGGCRL